MSDQLRSDKQNIDNIIKQFFGIFTNKGKSEIDCDLIFKICIPETHILKKNALEQTVYNLNEFISPRKILLTNGTLVDFEENETEEHTLADKNIAQRHSRYHKSGRLNGEYFSAYGTKFFHLVRTVDGWKINFVTWEDDPS